MHKIIILGPQGSGKGTQAKILAERLNLPALSMGQLLRDEVASGSDLASEISSFIDGGNLVPDELALRVLKKRLDQADAQAGGYVLDGYPRNLAQYEVYKEFDQPNVVLLIDVPREESIARIMKRAEIEAREDDTPEIIERRLQIYEEETKPVLDEYEKAGLLKRISGLGEIEEISHRIEQTI
ncbi:MAG: adenylate kinase [Patescibacteria group bacterium]